MVTQADYTLAACRSRPTALTVATGAIWQPRREAPRSCFASAAVVMHLDNLVAREIEEQTRVLSRNNGISLTHFSFNFNGYGDHDCLFGFRFRKAGVLNMIKAVTWPTTKRSTSRDRYAVSPNLATFLLLRRVSSPVRWVDLEFMFGKRVFQLSEICWEALEHIWEASQSLLTSISPSSLIQQIPKLYAETSHKKGMKLQSCVGFIHGSEIALQTVSQIEQ